LGYLKPVTVKKYYRKKNIAEKKTVLKQLESSINAIKNILGNLTHLNNFKRI